MKAIAELMRNCQRDRLLPKIPTASMNIQRKNEENMGIYFIQLEPQGDPSLFKVGRSRNIKSRLNDFHSLRPNAELRILLGGPRFYGAEPHLHAYLQAEGGAFGIEWIGRELYRFEDEGFNSRAVYDALVAGNFHKLHHVGLD